MILRTQRGLDAWNAVSDRLEAVPVDISGIQETRGLSIRLQNLCYAELHTPGLNPGVPMEQEHAAFQKAAEQERKRLLGGAVYDRGLRFVKRRLLG